MAATDPLSVEARKARKFTLGFCVLAFLHAYFHLDITNIQGVGVAVSIDRGSSAFIITVGLLYFCLTFITYANDDFKNRALISYQAILNAREDIFRENMIDRFRKRIRKKIRNRITNNPTKNETQINEYSKQVFQNLSIETSRWKFRNLFMKPDFDLSDNNDVITSTAQYYENSFNLFRFFLIRRAHLFYWIGVFRLYVLDFFLVPAITLIALLSLWHTPTRDLIRYTLPIDRPVETRLFGTYYTITAPR